MINKRLNRIRRHKRIRAKIRGTAGRPRLSVFRSHKHLSLQLINDLDGKTLIFASTREVEKVKGKKDRAVAAAKMLAQRAQKAGIRQIVFDRGGFKYHGRVKAVAEIIRAAGVNI